MNASLRAIYTQRRNESDLGADPSALVLPPRVVEEKCCNASYEEGAGPGLSNDERLTYGSSGCVGEYLERS